MSVYAVVDPANGAQGKEYPTITDGELRDVIERADIAARKWAAETTIEDRATRVRRLSELFLERRDELGRIVVREMGKPIVAEAYAEVEFAAGVCDFQADNAADFLADEPIKLVEDKGSAFIRRSPLGVLLGIMPWNYPYYQAIRFAVPNLLAGNTVIIKHAPQCPESAAALEDLFRAAGFPDGVYVNIYATNEQVEDIIADSRVHGASVTGSERAGAAVAEIAGRHLKKVVLELGGSDPFILLSTDDLDQVIRDAVHLRLENAGQACNGGKRFIVIDGLYEAFLEKFSAALAAVKPSDPNNTETTLGPLSSSAAADRLEEQVRRAVEQGATVAVGGNRAGNFFEPTILTGVTKDADAYGEEFFGPVAQVYRVADEDEAIRVANGTPFGLGSYIYTTEQAQAERLADRIEAGMVFVNTPIGGGVELPFGGIKRSGFGKELGRYGIDEFVNKKLIRFGA